MIRIERNPIITARVDPLINRIVDILDLSADLKIILQVTSETYVEEPKESLQKKGYQELARLIATEIVAALPIELGVKIVLKIILSLPIGLEKKIRNVIKSVSLETAVATFQSALDTKQGTTARRLRFQAAFTEMERARTLIADPKTQERDLFVINLLQAFCISELHDKQNDTKGYYSECISILECLRSRLEDEAKSREKQRIERFNRRAENAEQLQPEERDAIIGQAFMEMIVTEAIEPFSPARLKERIDTFSRVIEKLR